MGTLGDRIVCVSKEDPNKKDLVILSCHKLFCHLREAEFNQYMNLKYGNSSIADNATNISFLKDYVGHWFKTKFIHLLQVLIAWIIVGVTVIWSIRKIIKLWHKR